MKYYLPSILVTLIALNVASCGDASTKILPPEAPLPSPSPSPDTESLALIGNWIDSAKNTLVFNKDGSAINNKTALSWSINNSHAIVFIANQTEVDTCAYSISSPEGLNAALVITLNMACEKSGDLSYSLVLP